MIGIIGGSGFYGSQNCIADEQKISVDTRYGAVSLMKGTLDGIEVFFLSRHGDEIKYPPHAINHKANITALHEVGVDRIIATSAVGVLKFRYKLGVLTLPDQLVDMSKEVHSFYNGGDEGIVHTDISDPFCPDVIGKIKRVFNEMGIKYQFGGTYLSLSGPTFETKAEIRLYQGLGMTFVGMTIAAECKLAREMSMCYVPILLPVNYGAGMTDELVTHDTTLAMVETMRKDIATGLGGIVHALPDERNCNCPRSVSSM